MKKLQTPFGEIDIMIDGVAIPYEAKEGSRLEGLCPNVLGRYQISVTFVPDGKEHEISCTFSPSFPYNRGIESGEDLECQGFYGNDRVKMSIGLEGETEYTPDGQRVSDRFDYDEDYLENGMAYLILEGTKTERYTFGIAWIDDVGWHDADDERDTETWFAADPNFRL